MLLGQTERDMFNALVKEPMEKKGERAFTDRFRRHDDGRMEVDEKRPVVSPPVGVQHPLSISWLCVDAHGRSTARPRAASRRARKRSPDA